LGVKKKEIKVFDIFINTEYQFQENIRGIKRLKNKIIGRMSDIPGKMSLIIGKDSLVYDKDKRGGRG